MLRNSNYCSNPCRYIGLKKEKRPLADKFWEKVDKLGPDDCWRWRGSSNRAGYGYTCWRGKRIGAHHAALILTNPEPRNGRSVLHSCDHPWCVNPRHLRYGTEVENREDARVRDRIARGERHGNSKLTPDLVRAIRACPGTIYAIGEAFHIAPQAVHKIKTRAAWAHLD